MLRYVQRVYSVKLYSLLKYSTTKLDTCLPLRLVRLFERLQGQRILNWLYPSNLYPRTRGPILDPRSMDEYGSEILIQILEFDLKLAVKISLQ